MSLLLDALNKADKERKRNANTPGIDSRHDNLPHAKSPSRLMIFVAIVFAALIAAATSVWVMKSHTESNATKNTPTTAQVTQTNNSVHQNSLASQNNLAPQISANLINPNDSTRINSNTINSNTVDATPTHEPKNSTKIAALYQDSNSANLPTNTSDTKNASPLNQEANATITSINQLANIPELHDLPDTVLAKIPSMKYTEHHFNKLASSAQGGNVMINGNLKHINDQIVTGVYLDKILEDGILLHFENYTFKMSALNSWVNM